MGFVICIAFITFSQIWFLTVGLIYSGIVPAPCICSVAGKCVAGKAGEAMGASNRS